MLMIDISEVGEFFLKHSRQATMGDESVGYIFPNSKTVTHTTFSHQAEVLFIPFYSPAVRS